MSLYLSRVAPRQTIEHLVHEVLQQIKQPDGGGDGADDGDGTASPHSSTGTPDSASKVW